MKKPLSAFAAAAFSGMAVAKFFAIAAVVTAVNVFNIGDAQALCRAYGPQSGSWVNTDRNTREITRLRINYSCNDTAAIPVDATPAERAEILSRVGANWTVRLWGKCHPRDCSWGSASARPMPSGGIQNLYAAYNQGFATRRIVMRQQGNRLQLILTSAYRDGRPTRKTSSWFFRTGG